MTRAMNDRTGNLPPLPGVFPDYGAPIVREGNDGRELVLARWACRRLSSPSRARRSTRASLTSVTPHRPTGGAG
jgi:hypothetical protein